MNVPDIMIIMVFSFVFGMFGKFIQKRYNKYIKRVVTGADSHTGTPAYDKRT